MERKPGPIASALIAGVSWYSKNFPVRKGKGPLQQGLLKILGSMELPASGGVVGKFLLKFPEDRGWEGLLFEGTFETGTSKLLKQILRRDDVVFDVGANIGWYTVLISKCVVNGVCHVFEPQPATFQRLLRNCEANDVQKNVFLN